MIALSRSGHARSADHLTDIAQQVRAGTELLARILGAEGQERTAHQEELLGLEGQTMDRHFALMTHIRSVFLTPLPREDIYALSTQLNRAMEHVTAAGDLMITRDSLQLPPTSHQQLETLHRQAELTVAAMSRLEDFDHLEDYWAQSQRLAKQANRTHREWIVSTDSAFQPNIALQQAQLAGEILSAVHAQRGVAAICGSIIVRES